VRHRIGPQARRGRGHRKHFEVSRAALLFDFGRTLPQRPGFAMMTDGSEDRSSRKG
jgi:hypothetical protein